MTAGDGKPRSGKRRATDVVAFRLLPKESTAARAYVRCKEEKSVGLAARQIFLRAVAGREPVDPRLRGMAIMLARLCPEADQKHLLAEMISLIDGEDEP